MVHPHGMARAVVAEFKQLIILQHFVVLLGFVCMKAAVMPAGSTA